MLTPRDTPKPDAKDDPRSQVGSLVKGLRVLEAFTAAQPEMTLSEVAAATQLDPGTTHRMLKTLAATGYLERIATQKRFRLSLKALDLGFHAIAQTDLRDIARPILRSLVGEVSEAASLGVLDGGDVLYIERVRAGLVRVSVDIRIGTTVPAAPSAIGQAILAFLPRDEIDRVLAAQPRAGALPAADMPRGTLDHWLGAIRRDGYVARPSTFNSSLRMLAVPVLDRNDFPVAAISLAALANRVGADAFRQSALAPAREAAHAIARAIAAQGGVRAGP